MRYQITKSVVQVIGPIWMPPITCAMQYDLSAYDVENAREDDGTLTRESVESWISTHSGDFQSVTDFRCDIADGDSDFVSEWADEESESVYFDCMYGDEE